MKHQFLTLTSCFQGIFLNGIESLFSVPKREMKIPRKYKLVRWIKRQGEDGIASVGLFVDDHGNHFIIKHLQYRWKNLTYRQMLNEASLLEHFAGWSYQTKGGRRISFPVLQEVIDLTGALILVKKYEAGKTLETEPSEVQVAVITDCLDALCSLTSRNQSPIGERTAWQIGLSFPLYWLRAFLKLPRHRSLMTSLFLTFYRHWLGTIERALVVTHRDLYSKNILVSDKKVFILDLESMVLCTRETELALVARFNSDQWGKASIHQMLATHLDTDAAKRSFSALSIYYAIQMMVTDQTTGPYYKESLNHLIQYEEHFVSLAF